MLSDLVTNAVKYGSAEGEWRVRVDWYRAGATLRVAVRNPVTAAAWPRCGAASLEGGGGRGLVIVRALADDWWSECDGRGGVLVVFEVDKAWESADGT